MFGERLYLEPDFYEPYFTQTDVRALHRSW